MTVNIKGAAIDLNASNLWLETWRSDLKGGDKYKQEVSAALMLCLTHLFEGQKPQIRSDMESLIHESRNYEDMYFVTHRMMEIYCYFLASSQDWYISVHNGDYQNWRREQEDIYAKDKSDLMFI